MNPSAADSFEQQYDALRSGRAIVELADWSSVTLTGKDRQSFLNNFCTNDVKRLAAGDSCEAFFTNVKGKILGHGLVTCRQAELVIIGVPGQAATLIEHLDRYLIREDVQLRDTTAERNYLLLTGGRSPRSFSWNLIGGRAAGVAELAPRELASHLSALRDQGFVVAGPIAFTAARIEDGVPLFGVDFDEQNFPQEVGRDREAVSFTKGCYLGQETVARIDALGHVNQKIAGVQFFGDEVPTAGTDLSLANKKVGRVTSAAFSPKLKAPLALAILRREANAAGTRLESPLGECEVVRLPVLATA